MSEYKVHRQRGKDGGILANASWCGLRDLYPGHIVTEWSDTTCFNCLSTGQNAGKRGAHHQMQRLIGRVPPNRSPRAVEIWLNT